MTYAILSEWVRDEDVRQDLFIPSIALGVKVLPPTLWTKEISGRGRRKWNAIPNSNYHPKPEKAESVDDLVGHEVDQFEGISNWMISVIGDPEWSLRGAFPVLVTTSDLLLLTEKQTILPADLIARIDALRTVNNFPVIGGLK